MIDAKILATRSDDTDVEVWSVWIPRRGDNVIFTMEVPANFGTYVVAALYQKNYDEVGDGASASASMTFDQTTGRLSVTKLGAKEIVRFKLTIQRGGDLGPSEVGWFLFRFLEPVWFESVKG